MNRIAIYSALSLCACGGATLDVGSNHTGGAGSDSGGSAASGTTAQSGANSSAGGRSNTGATTGLGGGKTTTGGQATMGLGGQSATGAVGGQATMGLGGQIAAGAKGPTATTGGVSMGTGGSAVEGPPNPLVKQTCGEPFDQVWAGDTLDFFFNPQNDKWRLVFDGTDANGRVCGTATYVAAGQAPPPPAKDPDESYPPGMEFMQHFGVEVGPVPGVTYSIIQGAEVGAALHFRIAPNELWQDWCALQVPVPQGDGYGCVGGDNGWGSDGVTCTVTNRDGTTQEYPQFKCDLCAGNPVCTCDAKHCVASDNGQSTVFDLKIEGSKLSGTIGGATMIAFDRVN